MFNTINSQFIKLINLDLIQRIKGATVAIGLMQEGDLIPHSIFGTGFIVNQEGNVVTAGHVFRSCINTHEELKKSNIKTHLAFFSQASEGDYRCMADSH